MHPYPCTRKFNLTFDIWHWVLSCANCLKTFLRMYLYTIRDTIYLCSYICISFDSYSISYYYMLHVHTYFDTVHGTCTLNA